MRYLLLFFIFLFISCQNKKSPDNSVEAHKLFSNTVDLIWDFSSQIRDASDSLSVDSLQNLFEKRMVDINFSVLPETDLKLTEEENDSIFYLMTLMQQTTAKKLKELSIIVADSVPEK